MHHIYYLMGKSAAGKDTVFRRLRTALDLPKLMLFTTRPMRQNEQNGREYFFVTDAELAAKRQAGEIIEERSYHTVHGIWTYCTAWQSCDISEHSLLGMGTLESFLKIRAALGAEAVVPVYIEVDDRIRLLRAIKRESLETAPNYEEVCRRFLADSADFSAENLSAAGITQRFFNDDLDRCCAEAEAFIRQTEETI